MEIRFDDASAAEIKQHLAPENKTNINIRRWSRSVFSACNDPHASSIHPWNLIGSDMSTESYDQSIPSNLGRDISKGIFVGRLR